uniref:Uncharacterized protein n=1 Tax=Chara braunii TaxID=69332 RepID=A0A388KHD1_CHABU
MGTPSAHVRGSGPDSAVLMTGGAAGREEEASGRQGKSTMDVVSRRRRSGDTSVAGVGDEVPIDHKDRCWMLDWVGGIGEPSDGLVLYVVIKDSIVPIGGVVKWSRGNSQFAMLELTMVLNARGVRPTPSLRTTVAATRVPKFGQIGEKGPCRGQIVPSAPVKRRPTSTKEPVSLVRPPRYELVVLVGSHYFGDDDEENSEEDWERDEEREEYEEGGGEEEVESEHTISERGGPGELEGRLGVEYEDEGQEEETTGEGGYEDVHWGSKRTQLLASGHGHWEVDPGSGEMHREVGVEPRSEMQFISVKLDRILDIPDEKFRYNQRFLDQELIDDLYKTMVESGEAAIRERTTVAVGVNVCALYEKPVLLLIGLHDTMHTDASGTNVRARRVTLGEFDLQSVHKYYWYPLSGQHNVAATRKCSQERPDIARELRLDCWTARPVYYPDRSMENYCTLSTFQNTKDKWNTPPHQIAIIENIRKLWQAVGRPEAIGGSAADVKNKDYREFAAMALRATGSDHLVTLSLQAWSKEWSHFLGPYMVLARATDDVFEKVQQVYYAWESGQLSRRDGVKSATKQGESGKASRPGPGFELKKGIRVPMHWIQGTRGPGDLVAVRDPDVRSWKVMSTLGRRERLQLLRDILAGSVILAPTLSKAAHTAGKHSMETYVEMVKQERAMLRMFHYFVFISDPHKKSSEWKEPFFDNLSDLFAKYCDQGLTSERWIDQRRHFKETSWVRSFPATLGGEDEKEEESFKKTKSLANKCPEEFIQFVNKLLRRSETGGSHSIRMDPPEKVVYDGMEREPNAMVETLEHFCPADEAVVFLRKGRAGLVWELLKSQRHCIVLEGEGMKFEFLTQFIDKMVKTRDYYANFTKSPPRHDEGHDLVYKVGQNVVNIREFLFETKPQDRGECTYVLRRRKVEKLFRGYHKAPSERKVSFLDRLETMYFDQQIGAFTIAGYVTCFVDGEDFDANDLEEESVDGTLQAALAAERQRACSPASHSQRMGVPGTSSGFGGASSMAVSTDQLMTQPPTSSIVTPTQMAGNTMTVASGGSLDPNVLAMLSPELVATLAPFAHSPSIIMEL